MTEQFTVRRDENPDLLFEGVEIATVSSLSETSNIRWTVLTLYQTTAGRYVVEKVGMTNWMGEMTTFEALVTREEVPSDESARDEIKKFLGYGWLAKELYDAAEIEARETV